MEIEQVREKCKLGQGELCCAYLAFGGDGFECLKGTSLELTIKQRLASGSMKAKGDYCLPEEVGGR
jgi:hypothetical protein